MTAIELLASGLSPADPPETPKLGRCCVLGTEELTIDRSHAIKASFTNLDLLRAPDSDRVSIRAFRVITEPAQRMSSWVCDADGFRKVDRLAVRTAVLDGVTGTPWAGYITTSYKKHGALRAPVNTGGAQRWLFEMLVVDCSRRDMVHEWWQIMRETRAAGIPRTVMERLDADVSLIGKHWARWTAFERWARPRVSAPLYQLLCYLLPSEEELKRERD